MNESSQRSDKTMEIEDEGPDEPAGKWTCSKCTLENEPSNRRCTVCNNPAPNPHAKKEDWKCEECTLKNPPDAIACEACETPRPVKAQAKAAPVTTNQNGHKSSVEKKSKPNSRKSSLEDNKKAIPYENKAPVVKKSLKSLVNQYQPQISKKTKEEEDYDGTDSDGDGKGGKKKGKTSAKAKGKKDDMIVDGNLNVCTYTKEALGPFNGLTFVFSGIIDAVPKREDLESLVRSLGGYLRII